MPCYDPRPTQANENVREEVKILRELLNERTAQLCKLLNEIENSDPFRYAVLDSDIKLWHTEHKIFDELREK